MPYFGNFGFTEIKKKYCQIQSKKIQSNIVIFKL